LRDYLLRDSKPWPCPAGYNHGYLNVTATRLPAGTAIFHVRSAIFAPPLDSAFEENLRGPAFEESRRGLAFEKSRRGLAFKKSPNVTATRLPAGTAILHIRSAIFAPPLDSAFEENLRGPAFEESRRGLAFAKSRVSGGTLNSPGCSPQGKAGVGQRQRSSRVAVTPKPASQTRPPTTILPTP